MKLILFALITVIFQFYELTNAFTFSSITVVPDSKVINTVTRYRF